MMLKCEHIEDPRHDKYYFWLDDTEAGFLCYECAVENGFCPMCGYFVLGGPDDYTLSKHGICAQCLEELKIETGEYDDETYDDFDY